MGAFSWRCRALGDGQTWLVPVNMPGGWLGLAEVSLMCLGAAWVLIFMGRLVSAPYFMHLETIKNDSLKAVALTLCFGLLDSHYEMTDPLHDGTVRRWECVILRNISDTKAKNVKIYAEMEKFYNRYTGTERIVISDSPLAIDCGEEKLVKVAFRDETTDEEFIQRGGDIILHKKSEFGQTISQKGTLKLQAISSGNVICEAIFTLSVSGTGRLIIYETDC
jgi:hypothetical protein